MIIESIISLTCATFSGNSGEACHKAIDASVKQSGIEKSVNSVEDRIGKQADREARQLIGDAGMNAGAVVGGTGKAIVDRAVSLKIPVFMPEFFLKADISVTKTMMGLEWKY